MPTMLDIFKRKPEMILFRCPEATSLGTGRKERKENVNPHPHPHQTPLPPAVFATGSVWSPFNRSTEILTKEELAERSSASSKGKSTEIQQPVWTPRSAPPSPASERREFRPIGFESPTPTRRVTTPSPATTSAASVAAPWTQPGYNPPLTVPKASPLQTSASNPTIGGTPHRSSTTTAPTPPPVGQQYQVRFAPQQRSNSQEPTINSLLKSKDGKTASVGVADSAERLQKGSTTLSTSANRSASSSTTTTTTTTTNYQQQSHTIDQPDSGLEATQHHKMQQTAHQKVEGIGPITREGMPLTLRSEVDEGNRDKWYKQMYHTLHKAHDDGYPYKSSGYQSEPEPNYDSDYTIKYSTLDRRRTPLDLSPASYTKFNTLQSNPSPPQHFHQPTAKAGLASYRNQPGRIENYTPGRSSISEKESKEQLEHQKLTTSKTYTEGNLSRALKEQGYESDSTLVFRKREPPASAALSPVEQKQYYKTMQAGGEIPLQGFRKPAPEKPKDRTEESFDVKVEISEESSTNPFLPRGGGGGGEAAITCYPITSISRPLDMFGPFPKETRTFVPPVPPSRKSSRSNSTLKIMSQVKTNTYDRRTVLERTTSHGQAPKFRSKSAGPAPFFVTTSMMKEEKNQENSTRMASKRFASYRVSSTSPTGGGSQAHQRKASPSPVAFGRGISKERTFAEEKKRIEEKLPKVVSVSTSILRNPELKSPNEVKKALRSSYLPIVGSPGTTMERSTLRRFPSNATFRSASSVYSSSKSLNSRVMSPATPGGHRKEEKPYKVTITSSKGSSSSKEMKKSHTRKPNQPDRRPTVTIKSSFQKASKAFGLKTKTPSTQSLARTSSTYSIDSTNSTKRKSRICYIPITTEKSASSSNRGPPRQRMFAGSLDRGLKSLRRISGSPATVQEERYSERIVRQQAGSNVRTDTFFQNLFLKGSSVPGAAETSEQGSVLQKARQWNSLSCRSEPTLKQPNYYLSQARPVTSSKFKSLDRREGSQQTPMVRSFECRPGGEVVEQVNRFESLVKLTDEDEYDDEGHQQFGYVRGRRMKIDYSFHERSRSEPTTTTTMTTKSTVIQEELISTNSPRTIVGRRCEVTQQRTSRSPSCRRIQYLKGKEGQVKRIVRARSLSSHKADQRPKDALVRSHSLNLNHEPVVSRNRFRDLNTFYNSLERLGQLERVTSSSSGDLRPARRTRDEEIIDFDLWKRVRDHEKAERELNQLKHRLKLDQREKDLFFLPRDPDEVRWRSDLDTGLRNREKSVDDLKCLLSQQTLHFEDAKLRELEVRKDHYKPLWRGSSVIDVASQLEEKYSSESASEKRSNEPQSLDIISSNLLSTLSSEQMRKLKSQLSEIYSGSSNGQKKQPAVTQQRVVAHEEEYIINVPERASRLESLLKVRSNSVLTSDQINPTQLRCQLKKPDPNAEGGKKATVVASLQKTFEGKELDRATLSRTLCQELKDKILEKHHTLPSVGKKKRDARPTILPAGTSSVSVEDRRFLSLESGMKKLERETPASEKKKDEKEVRKERPHSYCDTESISSETSNKTVIFRSGQLQEQSSEAVVAAEDIRSKIKYFEERHTTDDTPTVTIYHARDDSSPSEDEVQQEESRKEGPRGHGSAVTLSQSFTDLKDLFGEKRSVSCSAYSAGPPRAVSPKHFTFRSRSSTPDYATCIQTGEVRKIKDKFESLDGSMLRQVGTHRDDMPVNTSGGDRQYQSDSELNRFGESEQSKPTGGTIVRGHEAGDVSRMTHKYEIQAAGRRKSRKDRVTSPIPKNPFRKDDRFMPHINVISKTASLKQEIKPTRAPASKTVLLQSTQLQDVGPERQRKNQSRRSASSGSEEFEKLKSKFETGSGGAAGGGGGGGGSDANLSLLGKMYTSVPDVRELKDIPGYLSGSWIAHQFPKPTDNARSLTAPEQSPPGKQIVRKGSRPASPNQHHTHQHHHHYHPSLRSHSSSPPRQPRQDAKTHSRSSSDATASFLRQFYSNGHVDGDDDDLLLKQKQARTKGERFVSNQQLEAEALWRKIQLMTSSRSANSIGLGDTAAGKPTVTFEGFPYI
ncbi:AGAP007717-PA-like protein [Anopheles sinensis]|uniref:AGAP007717-PA-like protein n=1 Tax=Anopheles sinensis TaxID=74873 RepID=A0A084VF55_ANOSI|nr:AGAP007717-PA-like protein [Anopheles sinensis]